MCPRASIHLKYTVNVIFRMCDGEMLNSQELNPNSLLAETDKDNLEIP